MTSQLNVTGSQLLELTAQLFDHFVIPPCSSFDFVCSIAKGCTFVQATYDSAHARQEYTCYSEEVSP